MIWGVEMRAVDIFEGALLPGSVVSVIYDSYSSAWQIPFMLLKRELDRGCFGVISNYNLPFSGLVRHVGMVGFDVMGALKENRLAIIDAFDSRYQTARENVPNVFYLDKVEPETLNPKIDRIYYGPLREILTGTCVVRLIHTLDGAALLLGEDSTLKLLNHTLALRSVQLPDSILILGLNMDVVSTKFKAWAVGISDYVLLSDSKLEDEGVKERVYLLRAPYKDFEPAMYSLHTTKQEGIEKLKVKKLSP